MDMLRWFVDFFLHLDVHLGELIRQYGTTTYAILLRSSSWRPGWW